MQVEHLAEEAGPLVEALPRALKRAVANDKVPTDLVQDILWLAARIEPYVEQVKAQLEKLPEQVEQLTSEADKYVDQASEVSVSCFQPHCKKALPRCENRSVQ